MKKTSFHPSFLQVLYLTLFLILFILIITTPKLITGSLRISEKLIIEEETVEGILLGILFIVSVLILNLYKLEVFKHKEQIRKINTDKKKVEDRLQISDQYIGMINVQIQEIKSIFYSIDSYPQTKTDLKRTFSFFGEKILGIVNSNWVLIRIINSTTQRTIGEHFETRERCAGKYPHISNKMIIERQSIESHTPIISNPKNLNILVFCVLPIEKISHDERIFIQAIIDEITKLFIIINSTYFKNENKLLNEDKIKENVLPDDKKW
ncbi:MAG: hypothetical protein P4L34_09565 [Paludibacter sp.]|nr:hypothetical protein [Paludibacter sp.]